MWTCRRSSAVVEATPAWSSRNLLCSSLLAAKHLSLLHRERILVRRKQGARVLYRIGDESVLAICELVCGSLAAQLRELEQLVGSRLLRHDHDDLEPLVPEVKA